MWAVKLLAVNFLNTRDMAASLEWGFQPCFYDRQCEFLRNGALSEREHVGVIVGAIPNRHLLIPAETATDALDAIGNYGFSVARAAQDDAAIEFAARDSQSHGPYEIRVIAGDIRICAEIPDRVTLGK